jgi:hypothetical protein
MKTSIFVLIMSPSDKPKRLIAFLFQNGKPQKPQTNAAIPPPGKRMKAFIETSRPCSVTTAGKSNEDKKSSKSSNHRGDRHRRQNG